jgi:uncharacterized membrane protein
MTAPAPAAPDTGSTQPVPSRRIVGVDATRGIALLGMMAVHALFAYDDSGEPTLIFSLSTGRSAAAFAVMAGVGVAFITGRRRVRLGRPFGANAVALTARALVVGAIGLALGYTDAAIAAVILPYYAVLFLLAIPLVLLGTRTLAATGAMIALGMPVLSHLARDALPGPRLVNPSFGYLFTDPLALLAELSLTGYYPALPWTAYLCAGLVLGRLDLGSARVAGGLLGVGAALAAAASLASWLLLGPLGGRVALTAAGTGAVALPTDEVLAFGGEGVAPANTWWWLATDAPHTATPPDLLHTTGVAVALLGALLLLGHVTAPAARRVVTAVLGPLTAAGSMILTIYTAHVVFLNSPLDVFSPLAGYLVQVAAALLFALGWRQAVGRGPLESLARWASRRAQRAVTERARST